MEAPYQSGVGASYSRDGVAKSRGPRYVSKDGCQSRRQGRLKSVVHWVILNHLLQRSCA